MSHKANKSFFDKKKPWSCRKDLILGYYLTPYLHKINKLGKPILIVDGFAGRGKFRDGSPGSPLIICKQVADALNSPKFSVPASVTCVESDAELCNDLRLAIEPYRFASAIHGTFVDALQQIEQKARFNSVFLYVDPYTVDGLEWAALDSVFRHIQQSRSSIEVLLNFNGSAFARIACSVAGSHADDEIDGAEPDSVDGSVQPPTAEKLNEVAGGPWWRDIVVRRIPFSEKVAAITSQFCGQLRTRFAEVCWHDVRESWDRSIPKYTLIFGSRHSHARMLMNDAMAKSHQIEVTPSTPFLFEYRPIDVVPEPEVLRMTILEIARTRMRRHELVTQVTRQLFGRHSIAQITAQIREFIKNGKMKAATNSMRSNDNTIVWVD